MLTAKRLNLMSSSLILYSSETLNWSCVRAGDEKPSTIPFTIDARQAVREHTATTHSRFLFWEPSLMREEVIIGGGGEESFETPLLENVTMSQSFAP